MKILNDNFSERTEIETKKEKKKIKILKKELRPLRMSHSNVFSEGNDAFVSTKDKITNSSPQNPITPNRPIGNEPNKDNFKPLNLLSPNRSILSQNSNNILHATFDSDLHSKARIRKESVSIYDNFSYYPREDLFSSPKIHNDDNQDSLISSPKIHVTSSSRGLKFSKIKFCLICERTLRSEDDGISTKECIHYFCKECLFQLFMREIHCQFYKCQYFQQENFKCPVIQCEARYIISTLKNFFTVKQRNCINMTLEFTNKYCIFEEDNKIGQPTSYGSKHILDCNSNKEFFKHSKIKQNFCPICEKDYLFLKNGIKYYVCLNCLHKFCKYCKDEYLPSHFIKPNKDRCKIYFRNFQNHKYLLTNILPNKSNNHFQNFFKTIGLGIIVFFLIYLNIYMCFYNVLLEHSIVSKKKFPTVYFIYKVIAYVILIVIAILLLIVMYLLIPYFPIMLNF